MLDLKTLRAIPLLSGMRESTLKALAERLQVLQVPAGTVILLPGDPAEAVYFVLEGEVRLSRLSRQGREHLLAVLGPGAMFNAVPLLVPEGKVPVQARALSPTRLAVLAREDFLYFLRICPDLAMPLLQDFAARLLTMNRMLEDLALHSVRGRLARFLLVVCTSEDGLSRRWTQDEIAAHLGTVRDVVGRTLRAFADEGLISFERHRIVVRDLEALRAVAEE